MRIGNYQRRRGGLPRALPALVAIVLRAGVAGSPLLPLLLHVCPAGAQSGTVTTIADTVSGASGVPARGTVLLSWPAFTTASGMSVQAGSTSVTLGSAGQLSVSLAPNAGATPAGTAYTAIYHLTDGTVTRESWLVPASALPVKLSAVKASVLPSSVAVQTVSKQYVDQAIARAAITSAAPADSSPYVQKAGDTMTGALILSGDPTTALQAADKNYVDANTTAFQAGLDQKVSKLPTATQQVVQPASTGLRVNRLNSELYASQLQSVFGNDGITNAFNSPECVGPCVVVAETDYTGNDTIPLGHPAGHLSDLRNGQQTETFTAANTGGLQSGVTVNRSDVIDPNSVTSTLQTSALTLRQTGYRGGNNLFPEAVTNTPPYFKSTFGTLLEQSTNYTAGQHVMNTRTLNCYGVGDCLFSGDSMVSSGGFRDSADEGAHPADRFILEDSHFFSGTCGAGCSAGSQSLTVNVTGGGGTQGVGRFLLDVNPSKMLSAGTLVSGQGAAYPAAIAQFTGTSFPVSTFFMTAAAAQPQSSNIAPGTVTLPIQTTATVSGFSTNTASAPAGSGVACVVDSVGGNATVPQNYETAPYTVVDGTHLRLTLLKPHATAAIVAIGGLCGYGLEQTVDTFYGLRQVFPIAGSINGTSLYVASSATSVVGLSLTTSAYLNQSYSITSITRSGGTVSVHVNAQAPLDMTGLALTVSGVADASFNGTFTASYSSQSTYTYTQSGPDASSSGGTIGIVTGGFNVIPMAEVLDVYDDATGNVDGTIKLVPNTVNWAQGDAVEEPHYFQQRVSPDIEFITQYTPRPNLYQQGGIYYEGINGPGLRGWQINNATPTNLYVGAGGTHQAPDIAIQTSGVWTTSLDMQAGDQSAIRVHCNSKGCSRFNSTFNLFGLDSSQGGGSYDTVTWSPQSSTMQWNLRGAQYTMSPTAMTVGTLNVTNLNAAHITGSAAATSTSQGSVQLGPAATSAVLANVATSGAAADVTGLAPSAMVDTTNAANITSGTISAARLPVGLGTCTTTLSFSATPSLAVGCANAIFHLPLTGNMTSMSFSGLIPGGRVTLIFQVGGAGGYTVQWPSSVHGGFVTSASSGSPFYAQAGRYFVQEFVVDTDGATLLNPGAVNQ